MDEHTDRDAHAPGTEARGRQGPPSVPHEGVSFDGLTLYEVVNALEQQGYTGQLMARDRAMVECRTCGTCTAATELRGEHRLVRIEGASDPADMMAVAALRCPTCGRLGTMVLSYGPEASAADADVLRALDVPSGESPT